MISVLLVGVVLHSSIAAETSSSPKQNVAKMQQVLRGAQERGKAVTVTLNRKIDNKTKRKAFPSHNKEYIEER